MMVLHRVNPQVILVTVFIRHSRHVPVSRTTCTCIGFTESITLYMPPLPTIDGRGIVLSGRLSVVCSSVVYLSLQLLSG